jgi:hypothetical protein
MAGTFCGSIAKNEGVECALDIFINYRVLLKFLVVGREINIFSNAMIVLSQ